jgi:aryl-alcohol dehydrogenase-like predicted oxidoreductase
VKLALGTVQFGLDYGAFGDNAKPSLDAVHVILETAYNVGVRVLDTAAAYGVSESVLGSLNASDRFQIVTKIPALTASQNVQADANLHIRNSLDYLKSDTVYGVMTHSVDDLLGGNGDMIWNAMQEAKAAGQVMRIGVSVYTPEQADAVLARFPIELIQLPFNIFDQRALNSGLLDRLRAAGVETHVRSVLLQGLLVSAPELLPSHLMAAAPLLSKFHDQCAASGYSPLAAALAFANAQAAIDKIVIGVRTVQELEGILDAWQQAPGLPDMSAYSCADIKIIDPSKWNAK